MSQVAAVKSNDINPFSAVSTADMENKKYRFAKFFQTPPTGAVDRLAFGLCDADDEPDGILDNQPDTGEAGTIDTVGRLRIELGATLSAYAEVGPDANGKAVLYGEGNGYAKLLKGGADGEVVDCVWLGRRRNSGTVEANDASDTLNAWAKLHKITISAGADTATLAAGKYVGQTKRMVCTVDGGGSYAITGAFLTNATATTTATFDTVGDLLDVVWDGSAWFVYLNTGVALS